MSNMSYCRFHNTLMDLRDCKEALDNLEENDDLPQKGSEEHWAMMQLIGVCKEIAANYNAEDYK